MKRSHKTILFFSLLACFLFFSFLTVFYSQGYRFDFETKTIVRTGGLFLKTYPSGAQFYLNGKLIKRTNFLFDSVFLNNLLPNEYQIQIKKEGYHGWEKTLKVEELKVTEAKHILLFPKKIDFHYLEENIENAFFSPSKLGLILKQKTNDGWRLIYLDPSNLQKDQLLKESDLLAFFEKKEKANKMKEVQFNLEIKNLIWSSNQKKIFLEISEGEKIKYFILNLETKKLKNIDPKINIREFKFDPKNPDRYYILGEEIRKEEESAINPQIYLLNNDSSLVPLNIEFAPRIIPLTFEFLNGDIIWLSEDGFLYRGKITNHSIKITEILNLKPLNIQKVRYKLKVFNNSSIFLFEDERLYYLNPDWHFFNLVFEIAKDIDMSPNNKKVFVSTENQIWLFYIMPEYQQPQRITSEKFLLNAFESKINSLFWLNSYYLIFSQKEGIKITEIDNRSRVNEVLISEFKDPKIFWYPLKKRLFALTEGKLFFCDDILK
jgi:hypothetical protein